MADSKREFPTFSVSLLSGALAGMVVDLSLFPLDTVKTRLQSSQGFWKAGGFRNIYSGIGSVIVGSSPGSAIFFCTYEMIKNVCAQHYSGIQTSAHMFAASCGEVASCIVRVPTEVVKQRSQANSKLSSLHILKSVIKNEKTWSLKQGFYVKPWQSSVCGAVAGSIAAAITTPLDVAKTRIMLAEQGTHASKGNILPVIKEVYSSKGIHGLFSGLVPRVLWISIGGAVFFGAYEKSKQCFVLLINT